MLPRNIDLTENRDFMGEDITAFDTRIEIPLDEYQAMTTDEYEHILWWEGIFGRKRHTNEKREVFEKEKSYINDEMKTHCHRCGIELRIPWKRVGDICGELCEDCNEIVAREVNGRIPWKSRMEIVRDFEYDLFNSR